MLFDEISSTLWLRRTWGALSAQDRITKWFNHFALLFWKKSHFRLKNSCILANSIKHSCASQTYPETISFQTLISMHHEKNIQTNSENSCSIRNHFRHFVFAFACRRWSSIRLRTSCDDKVAVLMSVLTCAPHTRMPFSSP